MTTINRKKCQLCNGQQLQTMIDYPNCALSNRFLSDIDKSHLYQFQLTLAQCRTCGLIQLINFPDPQELMSQFGWIVYREPEAHLDALTTRILQLPTINHQSVIAGVTYKDDTLLARLKDKLDCNTWRIDPLHDFGIALKNAGSETILPLLTLEKAKVIAEKYGLVDLLVVRHVFEHAFDTQLLLKIMQVLVKPNGYIMIEVPDCRRSLQDLDYSMLWEEHSLYFTENTFKNAFCNTPFSPVEYFFHHYPIENVMAVLLKYDYQQQLPSMVDENEFLMANEYAGLFAEVKRKLHNYLSVKIRNKKKVGIFGAGHISAMFINLMEISSFFACVVDDDINKIGMRMPGSQLPIFPSKILLDEEIIFCFSGLSPESEEVVIKKNKVFFDRKGFFIPIPFFTQFI